MRLVVKVMIASAGLSGVLLAGCAREAPPPPSPRPLPPVVVPPPSRPVGAAEYMQLSSSGALLVVRASELAMQRSRNDSTLRLAGRLKSEHTGIAGQLNFAGRRLNLLPSAAMLPLEQVQYDGLTRASDFDVAYLRTMRAQVENCVSRQTAYAQAGGSPTLRPVARFAASVCSDELNLFRRR